MLTQIDVCFGSMLCVEIISLVQCFVWWVFDIMFLVHVERGQMTGASLPSTSINRSPSIPPVTLFPLDCDDEQREHTG
jgi:hypothetical protein